MVNNSTKNNKPNIYLSPQKNENKKITTYTSGQSSSIVEGTNIRFWDPTILLIIESPMLINT
jgi:hypothetical protein